MDAKEQQPQEVQPETEEENEEMTEETGTATATAPEKKAAKKGKVKTAKTKGKAGKAKAKVAKQSDEAKIHLTSNKPELRGKRLLVFELIKNGMTVTALKEAAAKKFARDKTWSGGRTLTVLRVLVADKAVTLKG